MAADSVDLPNYDVSGDGKRFLMLKPDELDEGAREIVEAPHGHEKELGRRTGTHPLRGGLT
jgi:hypothetical protein